MIIKPKVIVLRTAGTNCDEETAFAFETFGAQVDKVHMNQLLSGKVKLEGYHIMAIPGGFTYGDDIASGKVLANELRIHLGKDVARFIEDGKLIIGICNGFQALVKAGFLPGLSWSSLDNLKQEASLVSNDSGKFEDRWTYLKAEGQSVWTQGLDPIVYFPVAHAEGKFVVASKNILTQLKKNSQIAFRYTTQGGGKPSYPDNPNGAVEDIAGITDPTGRILGLMPHPERHFFAMHHPSWTRNPGEKKFGDGAKIFENGVNYVKKKFL